MHRRPSRTPSPRIVITVPSSPENNVISRATDANGSGFAFRSPNILESKHNSYGSQDPIFTTMSLDVPATRSHFEELINSTDLPPPGPAHFIARRALWLAPAPHMSSPAATESSMSRQRLEDMLSLPNAAESDVVWNSGLQKVWKALLNGGRLKRRLPMSIVIRLLQFGWIRDGTWPKDTPTPETDDEPGRSQPNTDFIPPETTATPDDRALEGRWWTPSARARIMARAGWTPPFGTVTAGLDTDDHRAM